MKVSTIILHIGFAEDAQTAVLMFSSRFFGIYFEDPMLALTTLAEDFFDLYRNRYPSGKDSQDDFENFVRETNCSVSDTSNWDEGVNDSDGQWRGIRWYPFWTHDSLEDIQNGHFLIVWENGEHLLSQLLSKKYPDIFSNESFRLNDLERIIANVGKINYPR